MFLYKRKAFDDLWKNVRNAYHTEEISNIVLIKSAHNPVDLFTRFRHCLDLNRIMENNLSNFPVELRIYRAGSTFREFKKREL